MHLVLLGVFFGVFLALQDIAVRCTLSFSNFGLFNTWGSTNGEAHMRKNNFPLHYGHVLCKLPAPFPSHCMIGLNMCMSSLISTTIILSLCALRNYNHLLHNYNFKALYWGASV